MNRAIEASPRLWARVAGVSYLITIISGVLAEVFVRGSLVVRDDAAATAANLLAHERFTASAWLPISSCSRAMSS